MTITSRAVLLAARPHGEPRESDFEVVRRPVGAPGDGDLLVRNLYMSVDPYMRGRMSDARSYAPPFPIGEPLRGGAVGEVVESRAQGIGPGAIVLHGSGWREHAVVPARSARVVEPVEGLPLSVYLGVLGMPGLTAYVGLFDIAGLREGDRVFVSAAAGAVGGLVGQFARLAGAALVVGSAGRPEKVAFVTDELGFDAAFDYHDGPVADALARVAPEGIDVYFDNVGGEHLEAAIGSLRLHGRVALCGTVSQYNATSPPAGPRNLSLAVGKRLTLRGFLVLDHEERRAEFLERVGGWLREGRIAPRETVVDGIERAPAAFRGLLRGDNVGKMIVRLADV